MGTKRITEEEIFEKISLDNVDKIRGEFLERAKLFHSVKNTAIEKEHERLSEKLGTEHPRVKRMATRIQYNSGLFRDLDVEIEKAKIKIPSFDKNSWMVHGRVLDKNNKGISGLTLGLYDEKGNWIKKLGYGCTDKQGYFSIIYTLKEGAEPEVPETTKLFLYVSDKNYRILYRDREPLYLKIGLIDYREIYLSGDDVCSAPEPGSGDTMIAADAWVIRGRVTDESGQSVSGLTVRPFDKERKFNNELKTTVTDENGNFVLMYKTKNLGDLIKAGPDIYLNVLDKEGKTLYTSKKAIKCEAGSIESFGIKLKRKGK